MKYLAQTGTFSKSPLAYGLPKDLTITETKGAKIKLSNGQWVIDWVNGLGTNLYGYRYPPYMMDIQHQVAATGGSLTLPSILEEQVAERLCFMLGEHVPGWSIDRIKARFAKTGTDVTTMAIRLARAVTGRDWVITFDGHYHGWGGWSISRTNPAHGVLKDQENHTINYVMDVLPNDLDDIKAAIDSEVACVIFEHGINNVDFGFYTELRRICTEHGVLLIADEVVTGLRYGMGGACERYSIEPDLVCMGKALGNGLPISALIGRADYMDWFARNDPVFCSSTTWGEAMGLAAADYVLKNWSVDFANRLWNTGNVLIDCLNEIGWKCVGHGARSLLAFDDDYERAWFIQGMFKRGVLMNRPNFPTLAIDIDIVDQTVTAAREVWEERQTMERGRIEIEMHNFLPQVLFRNR